MIKKYKDKVIVALLIIVVVVLGIILVKNYLDKKKEEENKNVTGIYYVDVKVTNYGIIRMEVDANIAPITVNNFIDLVKKGFYDGLTFNRIMPGFMIQGGDPTVNGKPESDKTIKGEFKNNGFDNKLSHVRGTVSMYRNSLLVDSATSQFFIVQEDSTYLDDDYAAFGKVIKGMDVVDKIVNEARPIDDNGTIIRSNQPTIEYIKIVNN